MIAVVVIGGSTTFWECCYPSPFPASHSHSSLTSKLRKESRDEEEEGTQPTTMFSIASYLAEKISGLIPWRSTATVLTEARATGRRRRIEGGEVELELEDQLVDSSGMEEEVIRLRKLLDEARVREDENLKMVEEVEELRGEIGRLRKELDEERAGKGKAKAKDDEIGVDLYPTTISEEEVIMLLKSLNQEILDLAQTITRAFDSVPRVPPRLHEEELGEDMKEAVAGVAEILGVRMVELLQGEIQERDGEEVVKMALKASMAAYTHWIISSWYFENPEDEHLLSEIYARVREAGEFLL